MYLIYILLLSIPLLLHGQVDKDKKPEFWIIENPSALVIYDQYEQRLTEAGKKQLPGFSAWRIIDSDYIFSDQFIHTVMTDLNRKIYFIRISEDGVPVNSSLAGQIDIIKNAKIQGDTVRITSSNQLSLLNKDNRFTLLEGMLIERVFKYRNKTFGRDISGNNAGWIEGKTDASWEIYVPDNSEFALQKQLFDRVDRTVTSYNTRLDKLFTHLNKQYGKSNQSPQWIAERTPGFIKYSLHPSQYLNKFSESQSFLIQELSDLLYGSSYQVRGSSGQFVIIKSTE